MCQINFNFETSGTEEWLEGKAGKCGRSMVGAVKEEEDDWGEKPRWRNLVCGMVQGKEGDVEDDDHALENDIGGLAVESVLMGDITLDSGNGVMLLCW